MSDYNVKPRRAGGGWHREIGALEHKVYCVGEDRVIAAVLSDSLGLSICSSPHVTRLGPVRSLCALGSDNALLLRAVDPTV